MTAEARARTPEAAEGAPGEGGGSSEVRVTLPSGRSVLTRMPRAARAEALRRLGAMIAAEAGRDDCLFDERAVEGWARGIDVYRAQEFHAVAAIEIHRFREVTGRWPDLVEPVFDSDKMFRQKFFGWMPLPTPADKLRVRDHVPPDWRERILTAETLWRSPKIALPPEDAIPPGRHFVKLNNSTGVNLEIDFPLSAEGRAVFEGWLSRLRRAIPMRMIGEWWYAAIPGTLFVERSLASEIRPAEVSVSVYHGRARLVAERTLDARARKGLTFYGPDGRHFDVSVAGTPMGLVRDRIAGLETMVPAAEAIAAGMHFARVDFYRDGDGRIFLGEITLAPASGRYLFSDLDFERWLGGFWDHRARPLGAGRGARG